MHQDNQDQDTHVTADSWISDVSSLGTVLSRLQGTASHAVMSPSGDTCGQGLAAVEIPQLSPYGSVSESPEEPFGSTAPSRGYW